MTNLEAISCDKIVSIKYLQELDRELSSNYGKTLTLVLLRSRMQRRGWLAY
jgi:hypothetical protein